jgi:hypothetical protein
VVVVVVAVEGVGLVTVVGLRVGVGCVVDGGGGAAVHVMVGGGVAEVKAWGDRMGECDSARKDIEKRRDKESKG